MKNKVKILFTGMCALTILGLAGCQSTKVEEEEKKKKKTWSAIQETEVKQAEKTAKKYATNIFKGIREKNYKLYTSGMSPEMREKLSPKKFAALMKKMDANKQVIVGEPVYMGSARKAIFRAYFWKMEIRREVKDRANNKTKEITEEFLFFLPMSKLDGKYVVGNFGPII